MTDIKPYIKQIIESGARINTDTLKLKASELIKNNKLSEATLLLQLLKKDTFTKADRDNDGNLSESEIETLASLDGDKTTLTEADFKKLETSGSLPTSTGSNPSLPSVPATTPAVIYTPTPYTGPKATDIESYFKTIDQANYKGGDVIKHVNLPTMVLKDTNTIASSCLERGGKTLRILIHPKNFNEGCSVQEYKIDFSQIMALLEKKGITTSFVKEFPTLKSTIKLHEDNAESIKRLSEAIMGTLLKGDSSNIKTLFPHAEFRKGAGIEKLKSASFGSIPEPQAPPKTEKQKNPEIENAAQSHINSQSSTEQSTDWCIMNIFDSPAAVKLYKTKDAYRLMIHRVGNTKETEGKNIVFEFNIPENEIKRFLANKMANVDFNNINDLRNWIANNVKITADPLTAFKEKQMGNSPIGEIKGLQIRISSQDDAITSFNSLKNTEWIDLSDRDGSVAEPAAITTPAGLYNNRFNNNLHAITDLPAFSYGDKGWKVKLVFQDQYCTVFWWNEATSPSTYEEYVIPTANINNYLKDRTGKDFSGLLSTNYKAGKKESEDLKKLFIALFAKTLTRDGHEKVQGTEYYKRSAPTIAGLANIDFDKGPQKTTSSGMDSVRKNP